jgi:hypothetical protein
VLGLHSLLYLMDLPICTQFLSSFSRSDDVGVGQRGVGVGEVREDQGQLLLQLWCMIEQY